LKPDILTADWTNALRWDGKRHKIIKLNKNSNVFYTSDTIKDISRDQCSQFTNYISNIDKETSFERLIETTDSIKVLKFNDEEWKLSQCSCAWWHKHLKCNHVITLAVRLKKASYIEVAYSAPITSKRRKGRPALTVGCLARQPDELQGVAGIDLPSEDDEDEDDLPISEIVARQKPLEEEPPVVIDPPVVPPRKRGRPKKATQEPESPIVNSANRYPKRLKKN